MNRKELTIILDEAVKTSQVKYCDGGLRYQVNQSSAHTDILSESIKTHNAMGTRGFVIHGLSPVGENELKETLTGFFNKPLDNKAVTFTQKLINLINASFSPYTAYIWEADYEGYGLALVLSLESEKGIQILAMDWTID